MAQWSHPSNEQMDAQEAVKPLLDGLSENLTIMQKMVRLVGTPNDTEEERRKFTSMIKESQQYASQSRKVIEKMTTHNPKIESELVGYSNDLRKVVSQYVGKCKKYPEPYKSSPIYETDPLLNSMASNQFNPKSSSYPYQYPQPQSQQAASQSSRNENIFDKRYMKQLTVHDEEKMLAEHESKMEDVVNCLVDVNEMFEDLQEMTHAQDDTIMVLETNVISTRDHVTRGKNELLKGEKNLKKSRRNRCMLLFILIVALIALVCIVWAMKKN